MIGSKWQWVIPPQTVCTALNAVFDLRLDRKYYQPKELNKKIKKILG